MEVEKGEVEQANAMVEEKHELQSTRALIVEPPQLAVDAPTLNAIQRQIAALGSDLDAALALLVQRAQMITRASGAAIALEQGSETVCRASSGEAPPLGARLQVGSGFSGECVRTAQLQRCDDSEIHPLVDRETCRALGIRSMIAAPVLSSERVIGLLEVFSPNAGAFEETDAIALRRLADVVAKAASSVVIDGEQAVILPEGTPARRGNPLLTLTRSNLFLLAIASVLVLLIVGTLLTWLLRGSGSTRAKPVPLTDSFPILNLPSVGILNGCQAAKDPRVRNRHIVRARPLRTRSSRQRSLGTSYLQQKRKIYACLPRCATSSTRTFAKALPNFTDRKSVV